MIKIKNFNLEYPHTTLLSNVNFQINEREQILIIGKSASGKTSLGNFLLNHLYHPDVVEINFKNNHKFKPQVQFIPQHYHFKNRENLTEFYYQQRFESFASENAFSLKDMLNNENAIYDYQEKLINLFNIRHRLNASMLQLSSGERKKAQLIQYLSNPAQIIILDNPFIGMDIQSCDSLILFLENLILEGALIIIIGNQTYIPKFITHILLINEIQKTITKIPRLNFNITPEKTNLHVNKMPAPDFITDNIVQMKNVNISYNQNHILKNFNWDINAGEKWLLQGVNGAGKSTLLSLINADNPQAYSQDILIFGKRKGHELSIWDIKQNTGFVSPELHWYFDTDITCIEAILSGYINFMSGYQKHTKTQIEKANELMKNFKIEKFADEKFGLLSLGMQKIILLARALIQNPPLLIFDEPCQGLDDMQTQHFINLIDQLFTNTKHAFIYVSHNPHQIPLCITHTLRIKKT